jgi:hypothetical protein
MRRVRWRFILFWAALFLFWYTFPVEGYEEEIALKVTPKVQIAPLGKRGAVKAMWKIPYHEANVYYSFAYAGTETGSTIRSMDEHSPVHYERVIELPPGNYVFQACVVRNERPKPKTYCSSDEVEVR